MELDDFGKVIGAFQQALGAGWTVAIIVSSVLIYRSDVAKSFLAGRRSAKASEREQNWDDAQDVIKNLQEENVRVRTWRADDQHDFDKKLADLRGQLAAALETIRSQEAANARMRHTLNGVATWAGAIRNAAKRGGIETAPFPVNDLMAIDPDFATRVHNALEGD